jgi:ATP-binding cassette subfamily B protein
MTAKANASITHYQPEPADEVRQRPLDLALFRRFFAYTRPYRVKRNILIALVTIRPMQINATSWLLGAAVGMVKGGADVRELVWWSCGFLGMTLLMQVTLHFRQRLALELGEAVMQDIRRDIFQHLMRMPMGFFQRTKLGRILSRMTSDTDLIRQGVQDVLFVSMVQTGQMIIAGMMILYYDWLVFLVMLAIAPGIWFLNQHFRDKLSVAHRAVQESFSRVTSTLAESVNGIRVTQGFVRQGLNASFFRELITDHSKYNLGVARAHGVFVPLLELNGQLFLAILLILGGWQVLGHQVPLENLIKVGFFTTLFLAPIPSLGQLYNQALIAMAGAERVFRLMDTKPDWEDAPTAQPLPAVAGRVELRGVSFSYVPGRPVLHDISFEVEPGQMVALVGHTGSGKSSIINLLAKFYLPDRGQVLIDGHEIGAITSESLHRQIGIVSQVNFLFSGTIADNIRFGRPEATDDQIVATIRQLDFLDLVGMLPNGLNTQVGERGAGLSLGQRQLVCFARAMLADPRILILDEATSAVDTVTEARVQRALGILLRGRTGFVVAHRLSTIRQADIILVLDQGRIVERGTHEQLLLAGGDYAGMHDKFLMDGMTGRGARDGSG